MGVDTSNGSLFSDSGIFNFTLSHYSFGATSETDGLSQMRAWTNYNGVQFDLTFETSSPVLLNGGTGGFECLNGTGWEWSMPAGKTTGSLTLDGTTVTVDSAHSKTWYDREWGNVPQSWYWFEVHIEPLVAYPNGAVLSIWNWKDNVSGNKNFATVRDGTGTQSVVPVKSFTPNKDSAWTSNVTGGIFVQEFELSLTDGTCLSITSIRNDQEMYDVTEPAAGTGFEGYMTVTGSYKGIPGATGFAVSEQLQNSYSMWFE